MIKIFTCEIAIFLNWFKKQPELIHYKDYNTLYQYINGDNGVCIMFTLTTLGMVMCWIYKSVSKPCKIFYFCDKRDPKHIENIDFKHCLLFISGLMHMCTCTDRRWISLCTQHFLRRNTENNTYKVNYHTLSVYVFPCLQSIKQLNKRRALPPSSRHGPAFIHALILACASSHVNV